MGSEMCIRDSSRYMSNGKEGDNAEESREVPYLDDEQSGTRDYAE